MNTNIFYHLLEIEKTASISRAAENLFMAQPNLSKEIREVEAEIGYDLFIRTSKGVTPTAKGQKYLIYVRNIVLQLEQIKTLTLAETFPKETFTLSFPSSGFLVQSLALFSAQTKFSCQAHIRAQETSTLNVIHNVEDGWSKLGIITYNLMYEHSYQEYLTAKKLCCQPLFKYDRQILLSAAHPLASKEFITKATLQAYEEIMQANTSIPSLEAGGAEHFFDLHSSLKAFVNTQTTNLALECLIQNHNAYLLSTPTPQALLERYNLVQRPCKCPQNTYRDVLVYSENYSFTELDHLFLKTLAAVRSHLE